MSGMCNGTRRVSRGPKGPAPPPLEIKKQKKGHQSKF